MSLYEASAGGGRAGGGRRSGAGPLTIAAIVAGAGNYVFAVLLTHRIDSTQYSVFAASQTLLVLNGLVGSAGIPWVLAREVSRAPDDRARLRIATTFAFWGNLVSGTVMGLIAAGIGALFAGPLVVLELFLTSLLIAVGSTGAAVLQARQRTTKLAIIITTEVALKLSIGLAAVAVWHNAAAALLGSLVGVLALLGGFGGVMQYVAGPKAARADPGLWRSALRLGRLQIGAGVLSSVDTVAVAILPVAPLAAATYQAAAALGRVPSFISNAVAFAAYPSLVRPVHALAARVEALRSYVTVSTFVVVVLCTVPRSVLLLFFPASFGGVEHLLPYTATLGAGLGALNLMTTFAQSRDRTFPTGWTVLVGVVLVVIGVVVGESFGDVRGLSLGADLVCWATVLAIVAERTERGAVWQLLSRRLTTSFVLVAGAAVALTLIQSEVGWAVTMAVFGLAVLVVAFPDLSPRQAGVNGSAD